MQISMPGTVKERIVLESGEVRKAVAYWLKTQHGVLVSAENIVCNKTDAPVPSVRVFGLKDSAALTKLRAAAVKLELINKFVWCEPLPVLCPCLQQLVPFHWTDPSLTTFVVSNFAIHACPGREAIVQKGKNFFALITEDEFKRAMNKS